MLPSEEKAKLFQSIHALGLPEFHAADIITTLRPALQEYLRGKNPSPIRLGIALKKLIGQKHAALQLQGNYDKERRMWRYRVIDTANPPPKAAAPPPPLPFVDHRRKPPELPKPAVLQIQSAESVRVDSDGKIRREYHSQNPRSDEAPPEVRHGIWERYLDGTLHKVGDRWEDGAPARGYPAGNMQDAMAQTAHLAGVGHAYARPRTISEILADPRTFWDALNDN
jgi:hypothetical protein